MHFSPPCARPVVHITCVHTPFDTRIFHRECVSLAAAGYNVTLIAQHDAHEVVSGVRILPLPRYRVRLLRRTLGVFRAYWLARRLDAAVYHFHDPELIPAALLLKLTRRAVVIYDIHEFYSEIVVPKQLPFGLSRPLRRVVHAMLEKWPSRFFDLSFFPTERLRCRYAPPERSVTLRNLPASADIKEEQPSSDTASPRPPAILSGGRPYHVVFVGTILLPRMAFNLAVLSALAKRNPLIRWCQIGTPPATVRWVFENYDRRFLNEHLAFIDRLPLRKLLETLPLAAVGFNYHPKELRFDVAVPMKVFEYMAAGLPVVTTRFPELECLLRANEEIIFVDSDDPEEYADIVMMLLEDRQRAERLGRAGQRAIRERLTWDKSEEGKLLASYRKLLQERIA